MGKINYLVVIDDNPGNNLICRILVQNEAFANEFKDFLSPMEAIDYLKKIAVEHKEAFPEVIFLDINMPEMDGWEFLNSFRELPSEVTENCKIFMVSSSIYSKDLERAATHDLITGFITKPLTTERLAEVKEQLSS